MLGDLELRSSLALARSHSRWDNISTPVAYLLLKHQNQTFPLTWGKLISLMMSKDVVQSSKASGHSFSRIITGKSNIEKL